MPEPEQQLHYSPKPVLDELALKAKQMDLQSGLLGKLFGSDKNAPMNIAGLIALILLLTAVAVMFIRTSLEAVEVWKMVIPLLSVIMGYIFEKKRDRCNAATCRCRIVIGAPAPPLLPRHHLHCIDMHIPLRAVGAEGDGGFLAGVELELAE